MNVYTAKKWKEYFTHGHFNPWIMTLAEKERMDDFLKKWRFISVHKTEFLGYYDSFTYDYRQGESIRLVFKKKITMWDYIKALVNSDGANARLDKIREWYTAHTNEGMVTLADGHLYPQDNAWMCEKTEEYYPNSEESYTVNVHNGTEEWCRAAVDAHAFECYGNDEYYSGADYESTRVNGRTYCTESDEIYWWDSDGEYHTEPDEDGIMGYHDGFRPWNHNPVDGLKFGCELECYALHDRTDIAEYAHKYKFLAEEDGSLDDSHGVEIIAPPMTFQEHTDPAGKWLSFLADVQGKAKAWDAGIGYGLHISVNRSALTKFHTGKFLVFIHRNRAMCEKIAGRRQTHYAPYRPEMKITEAKRYENAKYNAVGLPSDKRIEVRIFRATLKPESFLKNVEFVAAAVEFTRAASALNLTEKNFLEWLGTRNNKKLYPNLTLFLGVRTVKTAPAPEMAIAA